MFHASIRLQLVKKSIFHPGPGRAKSPNSVGIKILVDQWDEKYFNIQVFE